MGPPCWSLFLALAFTTVSAQSTKQEISLHRLQQAATAIAQDNLSDAEPLLAAVLSENPRDADALNLLGVVRARQQRSSEAERLFLRALATAPSHIGAHINLGELYLTTSRAQAALRYLLAAHKLSPQRDEINLKLAEAYTKTNRHAFAYKHLSLIPYSAAPPEYYLIFLRTLLKLRRLEEARQLVRDYTEAHLQDNRKEFAVLLSRGGMHQEAIEVLKRVAPQPSDSFDMLREVGSIHLRAKSYPKAEEYFMAALQAKPDDATSLRALSQVARATGDLEKALAHLIRARRASPDSAGVIYDFGATAMQMGLILDALPAFQRLHELHPREPSYIYALAAARLKKGELSEAEKLSRRYVELRPVDSRGHYLLGAVLHLQNRHTEAEVELGRSLRVKADPDTEYLLGLTLYAGGNRTKAFEHFKRVVALRAEHAGAQAALGVAYSDQGNYAEARAALERSLSLDPNDLRATYQLGLVYVKLGEKDAGQRMLSRAEELRAQQRERETVVLKLIDPPQ